MVVITPAELMRKRLAVWAIQILPRASRSIWFAPESPEHTRVRVIEGVVSRR